MPDPVQHARGTPLGWPRPRPGPGLGGSILTQRIELVRADGAPEPPGHRATSTSPSAVRLGRKVLYDAVRPPPFQPNELRAVRQLGTIVGAGRPHRALAKEAEPGHHRAMELLIIVLAIGLLVGANGLRRWPAASAKASANSAAPAMRAANPATQRPGTDSPPER